jgi:hypothetical protein
VISGEDVMLNIEHESDIEELDVAIITMSRTQNSLTNKNVRGVVA